MSESSTGGSGAISGMLSDDLLEGQHEMTTVLRPERLARPVDVGDSEALLAEIARLCQTWGGAGQPLLPVCDGKMSSPYQRILEVEQIDGVGGLQDAAVELPFRVEARHPGDYPVLMVAANEPRDQWRPIEICDLDCADPWAPIYAVVLGTLPEVPDRELGEAANLREDLQFDDVVPVRRVQVTGSLDDLAARAINREVITPRQLANMFLSSGLNPDASFLGEGQKVIPQPRLTQRSAGPNLVVVVSKDSVEDMALLWNLRAAHGDRRVLPIGLPVEEVTGEALQFLQAPGRATMFGLGGGRIHLVSYSVPVSSLRDLVALSAGARAVAYEDISTCGPAPGRPRSHLGTWQEGRTRLVPFSDSDREVLRHTADSLRPVPLVLDVMVVDSRLPADPTMRGTDFWGRFQAGAAQVSPSQLNRRETVEVVWPSSWTCLAAVAQTRGLDVRQSQPGLAAATLIRALGDTNHIWWLSHHGLIALIYELAERSGMAWWKKRWTDTLQQLREAGSDPGTLENAATLLGRDDPGVAPPGEGRAGAFDRFRAVLGTEPAARHWLSWAERRRLLVRGADVRCPACGASAWLPMIAIPPPVACAGCGREILEPYGPRELKFTYRLGEPLRRVLETDGLGHVLALRWLVELLRNRGLVGAHPGVEFVDPESKKVVGEADVLLLFTDGSLVPVEVKRRSAGADDKAVQSMDAVADILDAPWDALVVTEPARDCESIRAVGQELPERPRLLLTTDQLHDSRVFWAMARNPFAWDPRTAEEDAARDVELADQLRQRDPDQPWNNVSEFLLDRSQGANHAYPDSGNSPARAAEQEKD